MVTPHSHGDVTVLVPVSAAALGCGLGAPAAALLRVCATVRARPSQHCHCTRQAAPRDPVPVWVFFGDSLDPVPTKHSNKQFDFIILRQNKQKTRNLTFNCEFFCRIAKEAVIELCYRVLIHFSLLS